MKSLRATGLKGYVSGQQSVRLVEAWGEVKRETDLDRRHSGDGSARRRRARLHLVRVDQPGRTGGRQMVGRRGDDQSGAIRSTRGDHGRQSDSAAVVLNGDDLLPGVRLVEPHAMSRQVIDV